MLDSISRLSGQPTRPARFAQSARTDMDLLVLLFVNLLA